MAAGPTARTLQELRRQRCIAQVVERWNPHAHVRQDLFGFADIIALDPTTGITAIQCTTGDHHANRREKVLAEPRALAWLRAGGSIQVRSWSKIGPRGCRKVWTERIEAIGFSQFNGKAA